MEYKGKCGTLDVRKDWNLGYKPEVYCKELNLGGELTEDNVRALLKWKAPRWFSPKGKNVKKVLDRLGEINAFRAGRQEDLAPFFGGSGVYDVFVKHIARPTEYPIYDSHVLNAYFRLDQGLEDGKSKNTRPELYEEYRAFFFKAYERLFGKDERKADLETVRKMKALDTALMEYDKARAKK